MEILFRAIDFSSRSVVGADIIRKLWEYIQTQSYSYQSSGGWFEWSFEDTLSIYTQSVYPEVSLLRFLYNSQGQSGDYVGVAGYTKSPDSGDIISNESLYGNWALAGICKELTDPLLDQRFGYLEQFQKTIFLALPYRTQMTSGQSSPFNIEAWATQYFGLDIPNPSTPIKFTFTCNSASSSSADALIQMVMINSQDQIVDIIKSVTPATNGVKMFERVIGQPYMANGSTTTNIKKIFVLVSTFASGITGNINVQSSSPCSDLMITRWNSNPAQEYQMNFKGSNYNEHSNDIYEHRLPMRKVVWVYNPRTHRWIQQVTWYWTSVLITMIHNKGNAVTQKATVNIDFQVVPKSFNSNNNFPYINGWYKSNDPPIGFDDFGANVDIGSPTPIDISDIKKKVQAKGITTATLFIRSTISSTEDTSIGNNVAISKFDLFSV